MSFDIIQDRLDRVPDEGERAQQNVHRVLPWDTWSESALAITIQGLRVGSTVAIVAWRLQARKNSAKPAALN
jgi:hypothetical protein